MANEHSGFKFFIITTTVILGVFGLPGSTASNEEEGSVLDIAQSILKESVGQHNTGSGLNILSGLVQGFMQSEGGKQLGDVLTKNNGADTVDMIANLVSMWQASQAGSNVNSKKEKKQSELNFDPSILGSVVGLLNNLNTATTDAGNNNVDENNNDNEETGKHQQPRENESPVNWDAVLSLAGNMISLMTKGNQHSQERSGLDSFLSLLPVVLNSFFGQHNSHFSQSIPHHTHSPFLPSFLENLHEYWDHFSNSEFGRGLWENSGLSELSSFCKNDKGEIDIEKVFESLGNNQFRRRWIQGISKFISMWVKHFTDVKVQKSYLETMQVVINSFLKSNGFPKQALFDLNRPLESISTLLNTVFKTKFNLNIQCEPFVGPFVAFIKELFRSGPSTELGGVGKLSVEQIKSRLSETIDSDVIEPVLRVYRAYNFSLKRPECGIYVMCAISQNNWKNNSGLKPAITKLSVLGASWFLSKNGKISMWDYFNAMTQSNCSKFDKECSDFHTEDIKATTEYYHNEL